MKDIVTDSLRYWEPRRAAFNAVLALVVAGSFFHHQPPLAALTWQPVIGLLLAAVLANALYCAAYAADLLVQLSDYQAACGDATGGCFGWRERRLPPGFFCCMSEALMTRPSAPCACV